MKSYNAKESGARIRKLRKQHNLTQEQLAAKLFVSANSISRIELGAIGCSVDLFVQLSLLFQVSLDYLIVGREEEPNNPRKQLDDVIQTLSIIRDSIPLS